LEFLLLDEKGTKGTKREEKVHSRNQEEKKKGRGEESATNLLT